MSENTIKYCPNDNEIMISDVRKVNIKFKHLSEEIELPGYYCPKCGEGIHTKEESNIVSNTLHKLIKQYGEIKITPRISK